MKLFSIIKKITILHFIKASTGLYKLYTTSLIYTNHKYL